MQMVRLFKNEVPAKATGPVEFNPGAVAILVRECCNLSPDRELCRMRDGGDRRQAGCLVLAGKRCIYFERAVLPLADRNDKIYPAERFARAKKMYGILLRRPETQEVGDGAAEHSQETAQWPS